tara:strand:+ start:1872 stop:2078 length:207 start_codon:yes stop_codon:yes gene_type:complete
MRVSEIAFMDMKEELESLNHNEFNNHNTSVLAGTNIMTETWVALRSYVLTKENTRLNNQLGITQRKMR